MSEILDIHPDGKGGQLKFRVDSISCHPFELKEGDLVDIYIQGDQLFGIPRTEGIFTINQFNLIAGRPKGYGIFLWNEGADSKIMWTPFIGDEGYIPNVEA